MSAAFASTGDLTEKKVSFTEIGKDVWAYTAEGDPNTGVVIGDDSVLVFDTQATPAMAERVIANVRSVTDKQRASSTCRRADPALLWPGVRHGDYPSMCQLPDGQFRIKITIDERIGPFASTNKFADSS